MYAQRSPYSEDANSLLLFSSPYTCEPPKLDRFQNKDLRTFIMKLLLAEKQTFSNYENPQSML